MKVQATHYLNFGICSMVEVAGRMSPTLPQVLHMGARLLACPTISLRVGANRIVPGCARKSVRGKSDGKEISMKIPLEFNFFANSKYDFSCVAKYEAVTRDEKN